MVTLAVLVAINLVVYASMVAVTGQRDGFSPGTLLRFGALTPPEIRAGQYSRVLASMFLHATPQHLASNLLTLVSTGSIAATVLGRWTLVAVYIGGGIAGACASLAWRWPAVWLPGEARAAHPSAPNIVCEAVAGLRGRPVVSVGSSGAVCGLIGAVAAHGLAAGSGYSGEVGTAMLQCGLLIVATGVLPGADNAAHLGGLVAGALLGLLLAPLGESPASLALAWRPGLDTLLVTLVVGAALVLAIRAGARGGAVSARTLVERGAALEQNGRTDDAAACYGLARWLMPRDAAAHVGLARAWAAQGRSADALEAAATALALDPALDAAERLMDEVIARETGAAA